MNIKAVYTLIKARLNIERQAVEKTRFKHVVLRQRRYRAIDQPVLTNRIST